MFAPRSAYFPAIPRFCPVAWADWFRPDIFAMPCWGYRLPLVADLFARKHVPKAMLSLSTDIYRTMFAGTFRRFEESSVPDSIDPSVYSTTMIWHFVDGQPSPCRIPMPCESHIRGSTNRGTEIWPLALSQICWNSILIFRIDWRWDHRKRTSWQSLGECSDLSPCEVPSVGQ